MSHDETIHVRVDLEGELAHKFNRVRKGLGLKNVAEVIRFLVVEAAKREAPEGS
jgi:predicted phage tail protein